MFGKATDSPGATHAGFDETRWTNVLAAAGQDSHMAREALENLCRRYRPPLYAFIRAQGTVPPDADDLVQNFLPHLLSKDRLNQIDPSSRFRNFLLACLTNFLRNEWDKAKTQKRGGNYEHHTIKASDTATGDGVSLVEMDDPSRQFEREWAATLVRGVLDQLKRPMWTAAKRNSSKHCILCLRVKRYTVKASRQPPKNWEWRKAQSDR